MKDERKTKKRLIEELAALRQEIRRLKRSRRTPGSVSDGEENFKALTENASDAILISVAGRYVYANKRAVEITGYNLTELYQMTIEDLTHPEQKEKVVQRYRKRLAGKPAPRQYETVIVRRDGTPLPIELTAARTTWHGQPAGLAIIRDISSRKKDISRLLEIEKTLEESEAQYHTTLDSLIDPLHVVDRNLKIILLNTAFKQWCRKLGMDKNLIGRPLFETFPFLSAKVRSEYRQVFRTGQILTTEETTRLGDEEIITDTRKIPIFDKGKVTQVATLVRDITQKKQTEELLQKNEQRYRAVVEDQTELICRFQPDGTLTFVNEAYCRYFDKKRADLIGEKFTPLIAPEHRRFVAGRIAALSQKKPTDMHEQKVIGPDGQISWQQWTNRAIFDEAGRLVEYQAVGRDITELKRVEEELRRHKDHLEDLVAKRTAELEESQQKALAQFKAIPVPTYIWRRSGRTFELIDYSDAALKITKGNISKLIGVKAGELYKDQPQIRREMEQCFSEKKPIWREMPYRMITTGENKFFAIKYAFAPPDLVLVHTEDITERRQDEEEIRRQKDHLDEVFNNIQEGIGIVDEQETILFCNPAFEKIFEQDPEHLIGRSLFDIFPSEAGEILKRQNRERKKGKTSVYELPLVTPKGNRKHLLITASPRYDQKGTYRGAFGAILDITGRVQAEEELKESKERLQIIFDYAPEAYYLTDTEGRFVDGNRAAEEMSGYRKEELIGRTVIESKLLLREDITRALRVLKANRAGQATGPVEFTIRQKNGNHLTLEISSYPITIKGELVILNIARDITEHKEFDQRLQESEENFRTTFEQVAVGMSHVALDGHFIRVNEKFCDIVGYSRMELLERRFQDITHPNDLETNLEFTRQLLNGEISQLTMEKRYIHKDGYPVWVHLTSTLISDSSGRPDYFISVVEDIGVRKWAEEELAHSEERLKILFEYAPEGYLSLDAHGRLLDCNRAAEELTGYGKKELAGKSILEFGLAPEEELPKWAAFLEELAQGRPLGPQEFTLVRKKGEKLFVELSAFPIKIDGQLQLLIIARDITERKEQEQEHLSKSHLLDSLRQAGSIDECLRLGCEALRESKLYQRAVMTLHNGRREITNLGQAGLDPKVVEQTRGGSPPDGALRKRMLAGRFRISRSIFIPAEANLPLGKTKRYIPQRSKKTTASGTWKPGDELFVPVLSRSGAVEGYLSVDTPWDGKRPDLQTVLFMEELVNLVARQIHEIQHLQLLKESEETARALMNAITDSSILIDAKGTILAMNEAAARRIGRSLKDLIGIDGYRAWPKDVGESRRAMIEQVIRTGEPVQFLDQRAGFHFDTTIGPIFNDRGKVARLAIFGRDITEEVISKKKLEDSERKHRELLQLLPTPVFELDLKGLITTTNQAGLDVFGYRQEDIDKGLYVWKLFLPEEKSRVSENITKRLRGDSFEDHEYTAQRKDGSTFPVIILSSPILRDGRPAGLRGVAVDISDRRALENTLRESEENFRGIAENVLDAIFTTDPNGRVTYISPAVQNILGYRPEEVIGKIYHAFVKSSDIPSAVNHFSRVVKDRPVRSLQLDMKRKDGSIVSTELTAAPVKTDGKITGTQGIIRDITERIQAREEIEKMGRRYKNIVNLAPDAIITVDTKGTVTSCNRMFLKQYGLTEDDILGRSFWDNPIMDPKREDEFRRLFRTIMRGGLPKPFELEWTDGKGKRRYLEIRTSFLRDGRGKTGLQAILRDVTEERDLYTTLERSETRLRSLLETAPDAIFTLNIEGRITSCNTTTLSMGGYARKGDLVGKKFTQLKTFRKADIAQLKKLFAAALRGESIPPVEFMFQLRDGTVKWGEGRYSLLKKDGRIIGLLAIIRDITQRKRDEHIQSSLRRISDAVQTSRTLKQLYKTIHRELSGLLKTKNISISLFDHEKHIISVEYHADEKDCFEGCLPAGKTLTAYLMKKNRPLLLTAKQIRELKRSGAVKPIGAATKVWMGVPLQVEGKSIGALIVHDYRSEQALDERDLRILELVSDTVALSIQRKQIETSLKESEELFHTLAEQSPHMIWVSAMGPIIYANKRCLQVFGYKRKDFHAEDFDFLALIAPESRGLARKNLIRHQKGQEVPPTEYTCITRRGRKFKILSNTKLISYAGREAILGIVEEIDEGGGGRREARPRRRRK